MARPKKTDQQRRTMIVRCRVSDDEHEAITTRAAGVGLSVSEYLRRLGLSGKVVVEQSRGDVETVRHLLAIGNNLNQLARSANSHGSPDTQRLRDVLVQVEAVVSEIIE